ncbi:MAG TPA: DMT family transporter [Terriglobales bacterium]|nr:DMT family transporter [Terriglobales bacterium]
MTLRTVKAHVLLVLVTLVWGATFVQIKDVLRDISPLLFNTVRMCLAAVTLALIFRRDMGRIRKAVLADGVLVGAMLWLGYEFQSTGLARTTPSKSAFLTGVSVVLVPVFLGVFWRKRFTGWTWAGVLLAFAGLYLMSVPGGMAQWQAINTGDLLTLACAVAFGFQIILVGRASSRHGFEPIAFLQIAAAAVLMAFTVPLVEQPHAVWSGRVLTAIVVTGLLGTAGAFSVQAWAQQFTSPTYAALIFSLEPVFAWLTSYLVLGERLGYRAGAGAALILGGILTAELKGSPADEAAS